MSSGRDKGGKVQVSWKQTACYLTGEPKVTQFSKSKCTASPGVPAVWASETSKATQMLPLRSTVVRCSAYTKVLVLKTVVQRFPKMFISVFL